MITEDVYKLTSKDNPLCTAGAAPSPELADVYPEAIGLGKLPPAFTLGLPLLSIFPEAGDKGRMTLTPKPAPVPPFESDMDSLDEVIDLARDEDEGDITSEGRR